MTDKRRIITCIVACLLVFALLFGLVASVFAASSSTIKEQIEELKKKEEQVKSKRNELQGEIRENEGKELDLVEQKSQIDRQIELTQEEIDIKNEEIRQYNLLISEKQSELDTSLAEKAELDSRYQARVRTMEETGKVSYWSILFKANSFSDMLDRVDMINEIAEADVRMLDNLQQAANKIEQDREELASEKLQLEQTKADLTAKEEELTEMRKESDELLNELIKDNDQLRAAEAKYEAMEDELSSQMAAKEQELTEALKREEEARRQEEARQREQQQQPQQPQQPSNPGNNTGAQFIRPVSGGYVSSAYGYRYHPITGTYSFHNGVDFAVGAGTPIKASAGGTVTVASYTYVWGYYVTINHGNGFSTLYAHMTNYIVAYQQHVSQGQVIGYVGSTGYSTGPHLHFTMYYNGNTVNPMSYVH